MPDPKVSLLPTALTDLPPDSPWWAKYLAENAGTIWKKFTFLALTIAAGFNELQDIPGLDTILSPNMSRHLNTAIVVSGAILAFVNQKKPNA